MIDDQGADATDPHGRPWSEAGGAGAPAPFETFKYKYKYQYPPGAGADDAKPAADKDEDGKKEKGSDKKEDKKDDKKQEGEGKKKSRWPIIILIVVVVIAIIAALIFWLETKDEETTDDAYTEGRAVTMAPKISGYVVALLVDDNTQVKKGQVLLRIDPRDYQVVRDQDVANLALMQARLKDAGTNLHIAEVTYPAKLVQAEAQRETAAANAMQATRQAQRQRSVDTRATSQQDVDTANAQSRSANANLASAQAQVDIAKLVPENVAQARAQVEELQAQVEQAKAQLAQADLNLSYTEIRAPSDGWVTKRNVELGQYAQPGQSVFSLVTTDIWIVANFKENQLARMRLGQKVAIKVDAYPDLLLHGHVDSLQMGTGSRFSTFPAENATGNFVKIVQRLPVKIVIDDGLDPHRPLPLGISVDPTVTLR